MTKKVFALDTKPGVQRDGTVFDKQFYVDGRWVRFQRGRPRKVGGYREITNSLAGPSRGLYLNPQNNFNDVFSGFSGGLQNCRLQTLVLVQVFLIFYFLNLRKAITTFGSLMDFLMYRVLGIVCCWRIRVKILRLLITRPTRRFLLAILTVLRCLRSACLPIRLRPLIQARQSR